MCFDSRLMAAQAASAYRSIACRGLSLACCSLRSQQHRFTYNEPMPIESCTQSLCDLALRFGEDSDEAGMVSLQRRTGHPHGFLNLPHPPPLLTHLHQVASTSPTGEGGLLVAQGHTLLLLYAQRAAHM
jgi:hypothetical protein